MLRFLSDIQPLFLEMDIFAFKCRPVESVNANVVLILSVLFKITVKKYVKPSYEDTHAFYNFYFQ